MSRHKVAILNEHPDWQVGLCEELRRRDIDFREIAIEEAYFNLSGDEFADIDLVINRASPSAKTRNHQASLFFTLQLIEHFERMDIPVINGSQAYSLEISKARQCQLFRRLGLRFPKTVIVNSPEQVLRAARCDLAFPIVLKPNIGGSGSGYTDFKDREDLTVDTATSAFEHSLDKIAVLQEYLHPDDHKTYRVQMIGTTHLYTISALGGGSNKCLAADCLQQNSDPHVSNSPCSDQRPEFAEHDESEEVVTEVKRITVAGKLDTCGVEYLIHDGKRYYFDINAMSVFADRTQLDYATRGDPTVQFVNLIEQRLSESKQPRRVKIGDDMRYVVNNTRRTS